MSKSEEVADRPRAKFQLPKREAYLTVEFRKGRKGWNFTIYDNYHSNRILSRCWIDSNDPQDAIELSFDYIKMRFRKHLRKISVNGRLC